MRKRINKVRLIIFVVVAALFVQVGFIGYSMLGGVLGLKEVALKDETSIEISQDVLNKIKSSDPDNYNKDVANYKALLKALNVHIVFKNEIERLIKDGKKLPDILIAYSFLNDKYGNISDLEKLAEAKASGKQWKDIFTSYTKSHPEFKPSNFDEKQLETLLDMVNSNQDDVMIADRVSQNTKTKIDTLIQKRSQGISWRLINAEAGIVNGQEKLPHVPVTRDQLTKYVNQTKLPEKDIVEALVLASKLGLSADNVLKSYKQGVPEETIYANAYEAKYY